MKLPRGFLISTLNCGIKKDKPDLGLIYCQEPAESVGFFTTNLNVSYSVTCSRKNIGNPINAVLVNSGNANCFSHKEGIEDTAEILDKLAKHLKVNSKNLLIASTGIIGKELPKKKIIDGLPALVKNFSGTVMDFASCILTTDKFLKVSHAAWKIGKKEVSILGVAKGAGMICPNMATMLAFIMTDAAVPCEFLKTASCDAVEQSFNSISVDGCMSTNDTVFILSSKKITLASEKEKEIFSRNLREVCVALARLIVKDGEGATKVVEIDIRGAKDKAEAKKAAFSLANSNLFKCAIYGENANWGRIIAALGQAGIKVDEDISINAGSLKEKEVKIVVDIKRGQAQWTVYTSDLTPEYIKINADYS